MGYTPISEILDIICDNNIFAIKERVGNHEKLKKSEEVENKGNTIIANIPNPKITSLTCLEREPTMTDQKEQTTSKMRKCTWKDVLIGGAAKSKNNT